MAKIIYFLLSILVLGACYRTATDKTFNMDLVVTPDSMVSLLTDIHIMEGMVGTVEAKDTLLRKISTQTFNKVLNKHKMTREAFEENIRYYSYYAEELDKIYEKVIINLSKLESEISTQKKEDQDTTSKENIPQYNPSDSVR